LVNILPGHFDRHVAVNLIRAASHNVAQKMRPFLQCDYGCDIRDIFLINDAVFKAFDCKGDRCAGRYGIDIEAEFVGIGIDN
jgi:hypothetical protein